MSAQRLNQPASIITAHAKAIPSVVASDVTPTQYEELKRKRVNVVTRVGGLSRLVGGYTSRAGYWLDASWWLLWIKNEMELAHVERDGIVAAFDAGAPHRRRYRNTEHWRPERRHSAWRHAQRRIRVLTYRCDYGQRRF